MKMFQLPIEEIMVNLFRCKKEGSPTKVKFWERELENYMKELENNV